MRGALLVALPLLAACAAPVPTAAPPRGGNVILVTIDGFRWQEAFSGAEEALLVKPNVSDPAETRKEFWRETPEARRETILPFLWGVVAKEGQILGDPARRAPMTVTNGLNFSYPGYNELLCGFADPQVDSNKKVPNPNVTVLEWLDRRPGFEGRVAACCSWDVFPSILNSGRSGIQVNAGRSALLEALRADLPELWHGSEFDALTFHGALERMRSSKPRVLYVAFGETDEFAHSGRYDQYLRSARRSDDFIRRLWEAAQAMAEYRGRTSLLITVDHGRGDAPVEWKDHGKKVKGAEFVWAALLGPSVAPMGVRSDLAGLTQSRVAATVAALAGEDYRAAG
ncbi:MAG TPA: alkaline phosphatase family protein, partial [Planctomycetota bacterium]|nr:alkaline phosphatase family protein [Planctomycetota bacterium]